MAQKITNIDVTNRILNLMQASNLSRYKLANLTKLTEASLSRNINGKTTWGLESLIALSEYFKVSIDWLLHGKDPENPGLKLVNESGIEIPLYGVAICGQPVGDWSEPKHFLTVDFMRGLINPFGVTAAGESMADTILPGDIVFGYKSPTSPKDGDIVIASLKTIPDAREGAIKRFKQLDKSHVVLYSDNGKYEPWIVKKSDIYDIFAVHNKIIRTIR